MSDDEVTAAALRAEIGRRRAKIYILAAQLAVHPTVLSEMLNERRPLPAELGRRALELLGRMAVQGGAPRPGTDGSG